MQSLLKELKLYPVSLGFSCHTKVYIENVMAGRVVRQPFDWIGCPMWSICELLATDFKDLTMPSKLHMQKRFMSDHNTYLTHDDYNVVFIHDYGKNLNAITAEAYKKVSEDYERRIQRWNELLQSNTHILFIRLETDGRKRIQKPEHVRPGSEYDYVKEFSKIVKTKHTGGFTILYLSTTTPRSYDAEHNILTVQYATVSPDVVIGGDQIQAIVDSNVGFIAHHLMLACKNNA